MLLAKTRRVPIHVAFMKMKIWRYSHGFVKIKNAGDLLRRENKLINVDVCNEGSHASHAVSQRTSHADCLQKKNLLHSPTRRFCPFRGNRCSSFFWWVIGVRAILYKFTNMKNPKQTFINQSRWDPLKNAFMIVKVERKATVFRCPIPSSPTIPTINKYLEPYKSRRKKPNVLCS